MSICLGFEFSGEQEKSSEHLLLGLGLGRTGLVWV